MPKRKILGQSANARKWAIMGCERHSSPNCRFAEKLGPAARPRVEKIHAQVSLVPMLGNICKKEGAIFLFLGRYFGSNFCAKQWRNEESSTFSCFLSLRECWHPLLLSLFSLPLLFYSSDLPIRRPNDVLGGAKRCRPSGPDGLLALSTEWGQLTRHE